MRLCHSPYAGPHKAEGGEFLRTTRLVKKGYDPPPRRCGGGGAPTNRRTATAVRAEGDAVHERAYIRIRPVRCVVCTWRGKALGPCVLCEVRCDHFRLEKEEEGKACRKEC